MSNMSYCRFENTANDLEDCYENIFDTNLSFYESNSREKLIRCAAQLLREIGLNDLHDDEKLNQCIKNLNG